MYFDFVSSSYPTLVPVVPTPVRTGPAPTYEAAYVPVNGNGIGNGNGSGGPEYPVVKKDNQVRPEDQPSVQRTANEVRGFFGFTIRCFHGFYGQCYRLLGYNPHRIQFMFGWVPFVYLKAYVFISKWQHHLQSLALVAWVQVLGFYYPAQDPKPWEATFDKATSLTTTLLAFLLGGWVARQVLRWRATVDGYQQLITKTRVVLSAVATHVQSLEIRRALGRYANLAYHLATFAAGGVADDTQAFLTAEGLLEPGEWERMADGDRYLTVYFWMTALVQQSLEKGLITHHQQRRLEEVIGATQEHADGIAGEVNNSMPMPYVGVVSLFLKLVLICVSTSWGIHMAKQRAQQPSDWDAEFSLWWFVDTLIFFTYICGLQGLVDMQDVLNSPFGPRPIDIAHEKHSAQLESLTRALLG